MASQSAAPSHIPPGFTCIVSPDGQKYLVPRYLVRSTQQALAAETIKTDLAIDQVDSPVSHTISLVVRMLN